MIKKSQCCIALLIISLILICSCVPDAPENPLEATTADGFTIKMLRYRPAPDAPYREGRQPVLLFPGIGLNMDQYLSRTPDEKKSAYSGMKLPATLASWAQGDPYIQADHMRYYSLAHYLYMKGYDPWFANYRDTGRGKFKSSHDYKNLTTLDVWANLDVPAAIQKVKDVTGLNPVIGGHSTGSFCSIAYLQGSYFDTKEAVAAYRNGYWPHVRQDDSLASTRNTEIKGFIAIDPAGRPPLPSYLDMPALWAILGLPIYMDIDGIMSNVVAPLIDTKILIAIVTGLFNAIDGLDDLLGDDDIFGYFDMINIKNVDPYMKDFLARYCMSSATMRSYSQYYQNGMQACIREQWMNGSENKFVMVPKEPTLINGIPYNYQDDGYHYYDQYIDRIDVPMITLLSDGGSMVSPSIAIADYTSRKTPNTLDEVDVIQGTSHTDIFLGLKAPTEVFPKIGAWLAKSCPAIPK